MKHTANKAITVKEIAEMGIAVALGAALSYLSKLLPHMPMGGTVALGIIPVLYIALKWGWRDGHGRWACPRPRDDGHTTGTSSIRRRSSWTTHCPASCSGSCWLARRSATVGNWWKGVLVGSDVARYALSRRHPASSSSPPTPRTGT